MKNQDICFRIDATDTIDFVDLAWFEFARQNAFAKPDVLGTSLWRHITDQTTLTLYQGVLHRVRVTGKTVQVSFRCDAPSERRFMFLEISPRANEAIHFRSSTGKTQQRVSVPLLDVTRPRSERCLTMCSWCKRILVATHWLEIETAVEKLSLFITGSLPQLTHSICPECEGKFDEEIIDGLLPSSSE